MPLAIKQDPKISWTDRIDKATAMFGRFELFVLILVGLLLLAGRIISYLSIVVILLYFTERWKIIEWLKEKYGKQQQHNPDNQL
jgi:hypothetical protein